MQKIIRKLIFFSFIVGFIFTICSCSNSVSENTPHSDETSSTPVNDGNDNNGSDKEETTSVGWSVIELGHWPQSAKPDNVTIDNTQSSTIAGFTGYKGSDNCWYYYYQQNQSYYKIEPIKWFVISTNFDHDNNPNTPGLKLLHTEKILQSVNFFSHYDDRNQGTVHPNNYEYSEIRAFLNGYDFNAGGVSLLNKGFLQLAFTTEEEAAIAITTVVNDERSTNPNDNPTLYNDGHNICACSNTHDKIFLLSTKEISTSDYGFAPYDQSGTGNKRIRYSTDYALATQPYYNLENRWWLRSPDYGVGSGMMNGTWARYVEDDGDMCHSDFVDSNYGIAPALCLNEIEFLTFIGTDYTELPAGMDGSAGTTGNYVLFGDWPQSEKAADVTIDETKIAIQGMYTYYKGSDNAWYYMFGESGSEKYYKVEPIKWRELTTNYDHDKNSSTEQGKKLLLAENILVDCSFYDYRDINRGLNSKSIFPNNYEHSRVRAFLNGLSYQKKISSNAIQTLDDTFKNSGFLQTAFTNNLQTKIANTVVDNSYDSLMDVKQELKRINQDKIHFRGACACSDTTDKIFLLSRKEITTTDYGFCPLADTGTETNRIHKPTDFARAKGVVQDSNENYGGKWWLRSPDHGDDYSNSWSLAARVIENGESFYNGTYYVNHEPIGVVPALCLD